MHRLIRGLRDTVGSIISSISGTQRGTRLRVPVPRTAPMSRCLVLYPRHSGEAAYRQAEDTKARSKARVVHGLNDR
jgi:hypothetical protein